MTKRPFWLWVSVAYMLASVAYNCWGQVPNSQDLALAGRSAIYLNLLCNFGGAVALFFQRRIAIYLLGLGFLVGLAATTWPLIAVYHAGFLTHLPITMLSFSWPLAMIIYAIWLSRKRVLI